MIIKVIKIWHKKIERNMERDKEASCIKTKRLESFDILHKTINKAALF